MSNSQLARLVRAAHRRIVERRIYRDMFPDVYESIRRDYWTALIERKQPTNAGKV